MTTTTTTTTNQRDAYRYLRSICGNFQERLKLGEAIRNGWTPEALKNLARDQKHGRRMSVENSLRIAIAIASEKQMVNRRTSLTQSTQ